jgi:tetratricopeptide (TPR) repeat protein
MDGKHDKLEKEAKAMISNRRYRYMDFESKINQAGYDMLNAKQVEPALFIFQLNSRLFPVSANTWDSLAEAYLNANQKEKAVEFYKKAIEMDPDGQTGQNARNRLKQIQK